MILNTFPDLLTYSVISPFILRIVLGLVVINLGYLKLGKENQEWKKLFETIHFHPSHIFTGVLAWIELIGGALLLLGGYTQLVSMVFAVIFLCEAIVEYRDESLENRNLPFYILIFAISLSLVFLGAGAFALDIGL
jgi:uncharacterized membrane protein YphA (DoxX/SURF4 family)